MILSRPLHEAVPAADPPAGPTVAHLDGPGPGLLGLNAPRTYALILLAALALSGLSLLLPSTPSYDPWCWLVWGRELFHGSLHLQGGASWKPLPVIFTTIFAAFGPAQPYLWLLIARAGFIATVLMSGKLAARLVRTLAASAPVAGPTAGRRTIGAGTGPAALAAVIAAACVGLTGGWISDSALGYSEGLASAFLLIGLERHLDGRHRQAFLLGLVAALDRPEIWAFWGPYGLWLMWRDPGARALVLGIALLTLVLWFVPQKLGGGGWFSGLVRATHVRSNSPALTACPFCTEMKDAALLTLTRIKAAAGLLVLAVLAIPFYNRRAARRGWPAVTLSGAPRRALTIATVLALFGAAWWVLVSLETQTGFSGNPRYLTFGVATVDIAAGVCFGAIALGLAELPRRFIPDGRRRLGTTQARVLATAALTAVFVAFPAWIGGHFVSIRGLHTSLDYQARLRTDVESFIARAGGPRALQHCGAGHIMTEGFQVPMVAWYMGERTIDIEAPPRVDAHGISQPFGLPWPNVIFQDASIPGATPLPLPRTVAGWERQGARYTVRPGAMRIDTDCRIQPGDQPAPVAP